MSVFEHQTILAAPIQQVWTFFGDPVRNLPRTFPPSCAVVIESAELPLGEGSNLVLCARDVLGRKLHWHSRIEQFTPPRAVVFGYEARFVDVQVSGPFALWRHEHELEAVDSKTTRMFDRVTYRLPHGLAGWLADVLWVRWQLRRMFAFRSQAMKALLET